MQKLLSSEIREALASGSYSPAFEKASRLERLDLPDALDEVLAHAKTDHVLYDALAVRWIAMAIERRQITLHDVGWASERFVEHLVPYRDCAVALKRLLEHRALEDPVDKPWLRLSPKG